MAKAKKPRTQHRRQPVKLAHGKTYADVLAERRSAERIQAFVDSANQAVKALSAVAQQLDDAAAKINELRSDLRSIEEEKKRQADPGRRSAGGLGAAEEAGEGRKKRGQTSNQR